MSANWGDGPIDHPQPQNVIGEALEEAKAGMPVKIRMTPLWMEGVDYNYTQTRRQRLRSLIGRVDHYAIGIGRSVLVGLAGFAAGSQWYAGNNGVAASLGVATLALAAMAYLELP